MPRLRRPIAVAGVLLCALVPATTAGAVPADRATALAQFEAVEANAAVPSGWTGSTQACTAGEESVASLEATLETVNTLRSFAALNPVSFDAEKSRLALAAALMMDAQDDLSHSPGPGWACYSADGANGAGASNLFLGLSGSDAMVGFVDDSGIESLGHRRWLLNPAAATFGSGSTGNANALHVLDADLPVPPRALVAWPPAGWVPWQWVFEDWSIAVGNENETVSLDGAQVSVSIDGVPAQVSGLRELDGGFGTGATLSWKLAIPAGATDGDHLINVAIGGVKVDGAELPIAYEINAFAAAAQPPDDETGEPTFLARPKLGRADGKNGPIKRGVVLEAEASVADAESLAYRWLRGKRKIRGERTSTYTVTAPDAGKKLRVLVIAIAATGERAKASSRSVRVAGG